MSEDLNPFLLHHKKLNITLLLIKFNYVNTKMSVVMSQRTKDNSISNSIYIILGS